MFLLYVQNVKGNKYSSLFLALDEYLFIGVIGLTPAAVDSKETCFESIKLI